MASQFNRSLVGCVAVLLLDCYVAGQETFELFVRSTNVVSMAVRTPETLRITDPAGNVTVYTRDRNHDTSDGRFLAYYSATVRQAILWPSSGQGRMRIGMPSGAGGLATRDSQMQVRDVLPGAQGHAIDPGFYCRLTSQACEGAKLCLTTDRNGEALMAAAADIPTQKWRLVDVGSGYYRLHCAGDDKNWSLAADVGDSRPRLRRTANDARQLWKILPVWHRPDYYRLTNAANTLAGWSLQGNHDGKAALALAGTHDGQYWRFERLGAIPATVLAAYKLASQEITPNPPLPPARVEMANTHSKELWVLIADLRDPSKSIPLKIPPGESRILALDRDAGATLIEVYETATPYGTIRRDEFITPLPPAVLYDVSVYELILQSVSIDRTVPGGKLDDANYSPKSVGWFVVPPGMTLKDGRSDVYQNAKQRENPGQVRRIDPREWKAQPKADDPVESLLRQFKGKEAPATERSRSTSP